MLNISNFKVEEAIKTYTLTSFSKMINPKGAKLMSRLLLGVTMLSLIILFLPWTQNIQAKGKITTLQPKHRPQTIHSVIPGKIAKWHVREGQQVKAGDTILTITEVKTEYMEPLLLKRVEGQVNAKERAIKSYESKIIALNKQIAALEKSKVLKLSQAKNKLKQANLKLQTDSASYNAAKTAYEIAKKQFERQKSLYDQGLKSLTDLEGKRQKLQETNAKYVNTQNKVTISQNEVINAKIELNSIEANYADKIAKSSSSKFTAESMLLDGNSQVLKIKSQLSNYEVRSGYYHVLAPQACYITKAIVSGIGEIIKEGQPIVSIMPSEYDYAVELYIKPIDYPLIHIGEKVQLLFDGWPFIVFSGWPNASFGSYTGKVVAVDQNISTNGKYRILIRPIENEDNHWPEALRVGSGARGMAMLNDVPVWYELWRQISGFPPEYYIGGKSKEKVTNKEKLKKTKY